MKKKICFVVTLELSVRVFLTGHMRLLQDMFDLTLIVNTGDSHFLEPYDIRARIIPLGISRTITPFHDLRCLVDLYRIFRKNKFDIIHSIMPKSGLLAMSAGLLARVPVRIHTFTGQFWKNLPGVSRLALKSIDRIMAACATHVLVDSPSQREYLIRQGVVKRSRSSVIADGSICGVDLEKFAYKDETREKLRTMLGIPHDGIVFLFLGRITVDKGVLDLAQAFSGLCERFPRAHLIIAGPDERGLSKKINDICLKCRDHVHLNGFVERPEEYMSGADVLCLPSYREGFGLVVAEAGAVGIPAIGSNIYGITDAIQDGVSGFLFEPGAWHDLRQKMIRFLENPFLPQEMGKKAREWTVNHFSKEKVTGAMADFYRNLI
jgi:glycosyltransferase involved in cell wall biosynthesis